MALIKAIRGMNDILPEDSAIVEHLEKTCSQLFSQFSYQRIATPIVEKTELFARSIGATSDIVSKEMYTFEDRNGDSLTLRPEGTASCVRAGIENGLFYNQQQRFWYAGPMFRHERPQKGRYRQFHQIGVEAYGWNSVDIDAEIISISAQIWKALNISGLELQINTLGSSEERAAYRQKLVEYLMDYKSELDEDSQNRLEHNPLRILDSKVESTQSILQGAPLLIDCLESESLDDFEQLKSHLDALEISYNINPKLVRGLDYYNKTVFEWIGQDMGAQATVCAGGRYDGLVEQLGGKATPAIGFAMGVERLVSVLKDKQLVNLDQAPDFYFISDQGDTRSSAFKYAQQLRTQGYTVKMHCGDGSFKNQMKKADKSAAKYAIILGEQEVENQRITLKPLLEKAEQITIPDSELLTRVGELITSNSSH